MKTLSIIKHLTAVFGIMLTAALVGCTINPPTTAEQLLLEELNQSVADIKEIEDHDTLADSLKIRKDRANAILIGAQGRNTVLNTIKSHTLNYSCSFNICACSGDIDCNDMFTGACRSPTTNGSCSGSGSSTRCTCNPRALQ